MVIISMVAEDFDRTLLNWLSVGAPGVKSLTALCKETADRLSIAYKPLDQFALYTTSIHPEIPGSYCFWTPENDVRAFNFTANELRSDIWLGSPAQHSSANGRFINHILNETSAYDDRPDTQLLLRHGYKQFIYLPLLSDYTLVHGVAAFGTKTGFTEQEINSFQQLQGNLARVVEAILLYGGTEQILSTYVGRNAGAHVLRGNILRGDTETIPSVVLFADLKGYTGMSNTLPPSEVIHRLNSFFETVGNGIEDAGGEILKFLGDGILAIYPTPADLNAQMAACLDATLALRKIENNLKSGPYPELRFRAALDIGDIYYGNVGTKSRLDFTAIGPTVNRAARLLGLANLLNTNYVCSSEFAELLPDQTSSLGMHGIKGFDAEQEIFGINLATET